MCKLNDVKMVKERLNAYAADCIKSDSTHSVIMVALITNASNSKNAGLVVVPVEQFADMAMGCSLPPSDMIVRWQGCPHEKATRLAPRAVRHSCADLGFQYKAIEKGIDGNRAEALEKRLTDYFSELYPFLDWKHIGNHRETGWRDIEGRDPATGKRKMLIEVKGRNGRCIARYEKEQA